ncbi:MAG: UDP-2,3-diacylglucosamine diphosphatase [Balneolaceae bacterium]
MKHLFISDVHLGAFESPVNQKIEDDLCGLIDHCKSENIQIHLLGDLFDYWMEYPNMHPLIGETVLSAFASYNKTVAPITYITGNHDNWTFGYFEELGFKVEPDFNKITIDDKNFFLHHGDGMSHKNAGLLRPFFHRILRNKYFINLYQFLFPPKMGLKIMKWFSNVNRKRPIEDPEPLNVWSENFLEHHPIDFLICGHDHIPRIETFSFGTYINLGTFFQHRTVALYTNSQCKLVSWDGTAKVFKPFTDDKTAKE